MSALSSLALATACAIMFQNKPEPYTHAKDSLVQEGVPQGTVTKHEHKSKVFAGTTRTWWMYLPADADKAGPLCLMVFQDGEWYQQKNGDYRVPVVFDNLIHQKKIPPMAAIFINPGVFEDKGKDGKARSNRSFEYDTLSPQYAEFLEKEMLPLAVEKAGEAKASLRTDAAGRGICGISSGGICVYCSLAAARLVQQGVEPCGKFHEHSRWRCVSGSNSQGGEEANSGVFTGGGQ